MLKITTKQYSMPLEPYSAHMRIYINSQIDLVFREAEKEHGRPVNPKQIVIKIEPFGDDKQTIQTTVHYEID